MDNDTLVTVGSGNVFADLGLPDPEERLFKAQLTAQIQIAIQHQSLTPAQAAQRMGLTETAVVTLLRGRLTEFTIYQLFHCLNRLGHSIEVRLSPEETDPADARTLLVAA
jgi:predicted XRE-type DNA-binding protein